jgi:hypothetical protein
MLFTLGTFSVNIFLDLNNATLEYIERPNLGPDLEEIIKTIERHNFPNVTRYIGYLYFEHLF